MIAQELEVSLHMAFRKQAEAPRVHNRGAPAARHARQPVRRGGPARLRANVEELRKLLNDFINEHTQW